jgi:hypothetical protein
MSHVITNFQGKPQAQGRQQPRLEHESPEFLMRLTTFEPCA